MAEASIRFDTDVHPVPDHEKIAGYLDEPWRTRYLRGDRGAGHPNYYNPNGLMRVDAVTADGEKIERSPQALARDFLDVHAIDYAILNPADTLEHCVSQDYAYGAAALRAINDHLVNDWLPIDPRFLTSVHISLYHVESAVEEIHRLGAHPRVVQVMIPSASPLPLGHPFYHPIYEAAAQYGLPIAMHPGLEGVGVTGKPTPAGFPTNYLAWHTLLATSYMTQVVSFVTEGVFQKFPALKVVLVEGGISWLPPILWRYDKNWKALRETVPWLDRPPSEIVSEHVLMTTQPLEEPDDLKQFHQILAMFDAENMLMFSSDFPHWDGDMPDFAAHKFPKEMRKKIMGANALRVYQVEHPAHA